MSMNRNLFPECYLIGLPKAGTTALYNILVQSSSIYDCAVKEPNFFLPDGITDAGVRKVEDYVSLYKEAKAKGLICLDASVSYSHFPASLENILRDRPDAKFIIVLRRPEDIVVSQYKQMRFGLFEKFKSFKSAWEDRIANGPPKSGYYQFARDYPRSGAIGTLLQSVLNVVPKNSIYTLVYEEIFENPEEVIFSLCEFIGVPKFSFEINRINSAKKPISPILHKQVIHQGLAFRFFKTLVKLIPGIKPKNIKKFYDKRLVKPSGVEPDDLSTAELQEYFHKEKEKAEALLGRKISQWWS